MSLRYKDLNIEELTPMMRQYMEQKKLWLDAILFYRLGDFYEMFFDDAVKAARILELALTGRDCGLTERAPMCGIPYHALDNYLNKLVNHGQKVAICEQVEDPAKAKGIVKREVVRVVTPGTITDTKAIDEKSFNYIFSVWQQQQYYGFAACDLTTGDFETSEILLRASEAKLYDEITRFSPKEIICNQTFSETKLCQTILKSQGITISVLADEVFSWQNVEAFQIKDASVEMLWPKATAALLNYLKITQQDIPLHIHEIKPSLNQSHMVLDATARANLEICETLRERKRRGSLLWAIDKTKSGMGSRMLYKWLQQPLLDPAAILKRQYAVADFKEQFMLRQSIRDLLQGVYDIERLSGKIALKSVHGRDLKAFQQTLAKLPAIKQALIEVKDQHLQYLVENFDLLEDIHQLLDQAINDDPPLSIKEGQIIKAGYHEEVDTLRLAAEKGQQWLLELEQKEREETGIKKLKIGYNRVFGYYFEVSKSFVNQVPAHFIRKQTLTNNERYTTIQLKEMEDSILGASQKSIQLEYEIFNQIRDDIANSIKRIQNTAQVIAEVDVLQGLAELADRMSYCQPTFSTDSILNIKAGRHPVVEQMLKDQSFVPNDIALDDKNRRLMILTGPNMAGKSTYMRQTALIVLLAQIGSFVPADSAEIGICDQIFTRVGASDDLGLGQSTFMVEMSEVAYILNSATPKSLLILDEIGRGTSTYDGLAIAWSVIEHVAKSSYIGARTLFATHYHNLIELESPQNNIFNCHIAVSEKDNEIVFLHQIKEGGTDDSYGIEVAALAGIPDSVVQRARNLLQQLEKGNQTKKRGKPKQDIGQMENQLDLFSQSQSVRQADQLIEKLLGVDLNIIRPIDAYNLLDELQHLVKKKL